MLSRTFISKIVFVFVPLALGVFTWGLQYKLSLYDPPQAISHRMPEAKLLSPEERTPVVDNSLVRRSKVLSDTRAVLLPGIFFLSLLAFAPPGSKPALNRRNGKWSCPPCRRASLNAFFFRPPPRLT